MLPVLLYPETSIAVEPEPSLKPYAATRPGGGGGGALLDTVTFRGAETVWFPAASRATAVSVYDPLPTVVVSQAMLYGAVVSSAPRLLPLILNCTPATATLSDADADTVAVPES